MSRAVDRCLNTCFLPRSDRRAQKRHPETHKQVSSQPHDRIHRHRLYDRPYSDSPRSPRMTQQPRHPAEKYKTISGRFIVTPFGHPIERFAIVACVPVVQSNTQVPLTPSQRPPKRKFLHWFCINFALDTHPFMWLNPYSPPVKTPNPADRHYRLVALLPDNGPG